MALRRRLLRIHVSICSIRLEEAGVWDHRTPVSLAFSVRCFSLRLSTHVVWEKHQSEVSCPWFYWKHRRKEPVITTLAPLRTWGDMPLCLGVQYLRLHLLLPHYVLPE